MNFKKIFGLLTITALMVACGKEDTLTGYTISLKLGSINGKVNPITITGGFAEVNEVEVENESDSFDFEVDVEGTFRFDLLTGVSSPSFPVAQIPSGTYDELSIEMGKRDNDTAVYIEAVYEDASGNTTDVIVTITHEIKFELEDETNGINIDQNTISNLTVTLDIEKIMSAMDWDNVTLTDGKIVVNKDINRSHYDQILNALNIEVDLDEDDD